MQQVEDLGYEPLWIEIPLRREPQKYLTQDRYDKANYPRRFEDYLIAEYKTVWNRMTALTGINNLNRLKDSIAKTNRLRGLVQEIKDIALNADIPPLPALELMVIEFGNLYGYADMDEWISIVEMILEMVRNRASGKVGVLDRNAVPVAWVTPSADPYLLNLVEDLGGRVVATEYVINQALVPVEENIDPFRALARALMKSSLNGSTSERIKRIKEMAESSRIKGVIITNMLGASHCAMETRLIEKELQSVPVLAIDVPAPFGITEQIRTRIEAFLEMIR
jgi:benzoyl-CoA reductase/2-hydroxyglutaryl-CoA dehydratase subunit BcrC/BadD/HgdB